MRVLVLADEVKSITESAGSAASILADLGCRISRGRLDLGDVVVGAELPHLIIIDAGDDMHRARGCLKKLGTSARLAEVPTLLVVTVPQLSALDFSLAFDDFVLSPIVPAELHARLRQLDWRMATFGSDEVIKVGELVIDVAGYEARVGGRTVDFTRQELELVKFLAQNRGRVYTREQLLQKVWGHEYAGGTRTVDIHVRRVRAKLGASVGGLIETVRHVGYKMRAAREDDG